MHHRYWPNPRPLDRPSARPSPLFHLCCLLLLSIDFFSSFFLFCSSASRNYVHVLHVPNEVIFCCIPQRRVECRYLLLPRHFSTQSALLLAVFQEEEEEDDWRWVHHLLFFISSLREWSRRKKFPFFFSVNFGLPMQILSDCFLTFVLLPPPPWYPKCIRVCVCIEDVYSRPLVFKRFSLFLFELRQSSNIDSALVERSSQNRPHQISTHHHPSPLLFVVAHTHNSQYIATFCSRNQKWGKRKFHCG